MRIKFRGAGLSFAALFLGLGLALGLTALFGENPIQVFQVLFVGALGSATDVGYSLYYATPLLLTGLSVAWAMRAGLFNIGADGQMMLGGVAMAIVGISLPNLPAFIGLPLALTAAFVAGGLWGAIAGWMKSKRGCHEVLSTILLNFIAYGLSGFLILGVFKNPVSQVPETAQVGKGYEIAQMPFGGTSPLNWSFLLALAAIAVYGFVMRRTKFGAHQRMVGSAPEAGRRAGINIDRQTILAMFISGGLAALAAASPVLGFSLKTREGFTSNAGFVGIAVALLGRNRSFGLILSALLFGILTKGALDLDMDTQYIPRDLSTVIQALIVLAVACQAGLGDLWSRAKRGDKA